MLDRSITKEKEAAGASPASKVPGNDGSSGPAGTSDITQVLSIFAYDDLIMVDNRRTRQVGTKLLTRDRRSSNTSPT